MDVLGYIVIGIIAIGALVIIIPLLGAAIYLWYIALPVLGAIVG
jgi:hypothetical protein